MLAKLSVSSPFPTTSTSDVDTLLDCSLFAAVLTVSADSQETVNFVDALLPPTDGLLFLDLRLFCVSVDRERMRAPGRDCCLFQPVTFRKLDVVPYLFALTARVLATGRSASAGGIFHEPRKLPMSCPTTRQFVDVLVSSKAGEPSTSGWRAPGSVSTDGSHVALNETGDVESVHVVAGTNPARGTPPASVKSATQSASTPTRIFDGEEIPRLPMVLPGHATESNVSSSVDGSLIPKGLPTSENAEELSTPDLAGATSQCSSSVDCSLLAADLSFDGALKPTGFEGTVTSVLPPCFLSVLGSTTAAVPSEANCEDRGATTSLSTVPRGWPRSWPRTSKAASADSSLISKPLRTPRSSTGTSESFVSGGAQTALQWVGAGWSCGLSTAAVCRMSSSGTTSARDSVSGDVNGDGH